MAKYNAFQISMYDCYNKDMRKHQKNLSYKFWKKWEARLQKEARRKWTKTKRYEWLSQHLKALKRAKRDWHKINCIDCDEFLDRCVCNESTN